MTTVRQSALQIWKSLVSNTPRILLEIVPVLVDQLVTKLSSEIEDLRVVAGKSLGELVFKLGDRVLPRVVPHLRQQLKLSRHAGMDETEAEAVRQGVCLGLTEILGAATKHQIEAYIGTLVPALQTALCDRSDHVRSLAATGFQTLFKNIGPRAVNDVVAALLFRLHVNITGTGYHDDFAGDDEEESCSGGGHSDSDSEMQALALLGLQSVAETRPRDVLEYMLVGAGSSTDSKDTFKLLKHPVQTASARCLASIVPVVGHHLNHHLSVLVPVLCKELLTVNENIDTYSSSSDGSGNEELLIQEKLRKVALEECAGAVMGAVTSSGVNSLVSDLGKQIEHETDLKRRRWGCWLMEQFFRRSKADYSEYVPVMLKYLLARVAEHDKGLLQSVSDALLALTTAAQSSDDIITLDDLVSHLSFMQNCINSTGKLSCCYHHHWYSIVYVYYNIITSH